MPKLKKKKEPQQAASAWQQAALEKRKLKAIGKKNRRDPKATKLTTNKEKAAARQAARTGR